MNTYTINRNTQDGYATVTFALDLGNGDVRVYTQDLCGLPVGDDGALQTALQVYADSYAASLRTQ